MKHKIALPAMTSIFSAEFVYTKSQYVVFRFFYFSCKFLPISPTPNSKRSSPSPLAHFFAHSSVQDECPLSNVNRVNRSVYFNCELLKSLSCNGYRFSQGKEFFLGFPLGKARLRLRSRLSDDVVLLRACSKSIFCAMGKKRLTDKR